MPFEEAGHSYEPGDDEHDTPEPFFRPFHRILGGFDLDPAASDTSDLAEQNVTKDEDGMSMDWWGDVWLNPPYSEVGDWLDYGERQVACGNVTNLVALVYARTGTQWFHNIAVYADLMCLVEGRRAGPATTRACPGRRAGRARHGRPREQPDGGGRPRWRRGRPSALESRRARRDGWRLDRRPPAWGAGGVGGARDRERGRGGAGRVEHEPDHALRGCARVSPRCAHCDSWVSETWCRVVLPDGMDKPERCPACATRDAARLAAGLDPMLGRGPGGRR